MSMDVIRQMVNEVRSPYDFVVACLSVQHRVESGRDVDASLLLSLAVKGHDLVVQHGLTNDPDDVKAYTAQEISAHFMRTFTATPGTMEHNAQKV